MSGIDDNLVLETIILWIRDRIPEEDADIRPDTRLLETSLLNSMDLLEMVTYIEDRYGIEFDPDDMVPENFESPARIVELVIGSHGPNVSIILDAAAGPSRVQSSRSARMILPISFRGNLSRNSMICGTSKLARR